MSVSVKQKSLLKSATKLSGQNTTRCPRCQETFNLTNNRPMTLQCLHCFCEQCIIQMFSANKNRKLTCNLCKKQTKIAKDQVADSLPVNYAILDSMTANKEMEVASVTVSFQREDLPKTSMGMNGKVNDVTVVPIGQPSLRDKKSQQNEIPISKDSTGVKEKANDKWQSSDKHEMSKTSDKLPPKRMSDNASLTSKTTASATQSKISPSNSPTTHQSQGMQYLTVSLNMASKINSVPGSNVKATSTVMHLQSGSSPESSSFASSQMTSTTAVSLNSKTMPSDTSVSDSGSTQTITSLSVKSPTAHPSIPKESKTSASSESETKPISLINPSDLCIRCCVNPAQLSVANAREMKSEKLCTKCYLVDQQPTVTQGDKHDSRMKNISKNNDQKTTSDASFASTGSAGLKSQSTKTVIKVQDQPGNKAAKDATSKVSTFTEVRSNTPPQNDGTVKTEFSKNAEDADSTDMLLKMLAEYRGNNSQNGEIVDKNTMSTTYALGPTTNTKSKNTISAKSNPSVSELKNYENQNNIGRPVSTLIIQPKQDTRTEYILKESTNGIVDTDETSSLPSQANEAINENVPPSVRYQTPSMNMTTTINLSDDGNSRSMQYPSEQQLLLTDEERSRPDSFNPLYRDDANRFPYQSPGGIPTPAYSQLANGSEPSPLYTPSLFRSKAEEIQHNEAGGGALFDDAPCYPATAPPRYEDVIKEDIDLSNAQKSHSGSGSNVGRTGNIRCVKSFGRYGELSTQPGAFSSPTRISVSTRGTVVVVDPKNMTVQAFTPEGECLALIRVQGVNGCCCLSTDKLAVATNKGVEIYDFNGTLFKSITLGPVTNAVAHKQNFIAVQPKTLSIFSVSSLSLVKTLSSRSRQGRQPEPFDNIVDVAVNSQEDLVVLDAGAAGGNGAIYLMTKNGILKGAILPNQEACGRFSSPTAISVDRSDNVLVSDSLNKRVLLFGASGNLVRCLLGPGLGSTVLAPPGGLAWPAGIDVSEAGQLYVVARGEKFAEIRVFVFNA